MNTTLDTLQDDYNRARRLWDRGIISDEAYDRARDALQDAMRATYGDSLDSLPWNDSLGN
jgi:multidrug resistance efflux pump